MSDEKATKTFLSSALKERGIFYYNTRDSGRAGVPDVYVCSSTGRSVWLELKRKRDGKNTLGHPLTKLQSNFLKKINERGGLGLMVVHLGANVWCVRQVKEIGEVDELDWEDTIGTEELLEMIDT